MFEGARLCSGSSRQEFGRGKQEHEEDKRIRMSMEEDRRRCWLDGYGSLILGFDFAGSLVFG